MGALLCKIFGILCPAPSFPTTAFPTTPAFVFFPTLAPTSNADVGVAKVTPTDGPSLSSFSKTPVPTVRPTSIHDDELMTPRPTLTLTDRPTMNLPTGIPTMGVTEKPSLVTNPTTTTTDTPTAEKPTGVPTMGSTDTPTFAITAMPTLATTDTPTLDPTRTPTVGPTTNLDFVQAPTKGTTSTEIPTVGPTNTSTVDAPTIGPTPTTTDAPTAGPTPTATDSPTAGPTTPATDAPTVGPTTTTTDSPTAGPTTTTTDAPTVGPTTTATHTPTVGPTTTATDAPTIGPSLTTTHTPTAGPTTTATHTPTAGPTPGRDENSLLTDIPTFDSSVIRQCPDLDADPIEFSQGGVQTFQLSETNVLCMLFFLDGAARVPVVRSYNGQPWEKYNNGFAALEDPLCSNDTMTCQMELPIPEEGRYQLISTTYSPVSPLDPYARFLEQATFGGTYDEITSLAAMENDAGTAGLVMANWIQQQQDTVEPSFHRKFYRERVNARFGSSSRIGHVSHPCHVGTFYRRYAFSEKDEENAVLLSTTSSGRRMVRINGEVRSVYSTIEIGDENGTLALADGSYFFCEEPSPTLGGQLWVTGPNGCQTLYFDGQFGNPAVNLVGSTQPTLTLDLSGHVVLSTVLNTLTDEVQMIDTPVDDDVCESIVLTNGNAPIVFGLVDSELLIHDPRFVLRDNTPSNPIPDGGGALEEATTGNPDYEALCSNVARTPFNEESCFLSTEPSACANLDIPSLPVELTTTTLRDFYTDTDGERYVYAITGLNITADRIAAFPCTQSARSRWVAVEDKDVTECGMENGVDTITEDLFVTLLDTSTDSNTFIRDILFPEQNFVCSDQHAESKGFEVYSTATNTCWLNVHPDHLQVYDMTVWTVLHPGGGDAIKQFALAGEVILEFPYSSFHGMDRWTDNKRRFYNLGRLGDTTDYRDLPLELQTIPLNEDSIGDMFTSGVVVCAGTEGEVANKPELGGTYGQGAFDIYTNYNATTPNRRIQRQAKVVWTSVVLGAQDQLRQRVAWALSQVFAISPDDVGGRGTVEQYLAFYDIFVRNAFTNYRNIMKEVAYSVPMAIMLTYRGSRSTAFEWQRAPGNLLFPDENFAREIMQLFSIGLYELNGDGTIIKDTVGKSVGTYSNDEIIEYARVWTGFNSQSRRGNTEFSNRNRIDPMRIDPRWRDLFPKSGLGRKYIGEGYPLCTDLPSGHFLRRGAKFRLLGYGLPEYQQFPSSWASDPERVDIELAFSASASSLFSKLCAPLDPMNPFSPCSYPATVRLTNDLVCEGNEVECSVPTLDVVRLPGGVYYEYVRQPCVHQTFYNFPRKIKQRQGRGGNEFMCADPRTEVASTACCATRTNNAYLGEQAWGQRVKLDVSEQVCTTLPTNSGIPGGLCSRNNIRLQNCLGSRCSLALFHWTTLACQLLVKIDSDLRIAMVHETDDNRQDRLVSYVQEDTKTFFRVDWENDADAIDLFENCRSNPDCSISVDQYCMCSTTTSESAAFSIATPALHGMPSVEEVLSLTVGALEPDAYFGALSYNQGTVGGVTVFYQAEIDENAIFRVTDDTGRVHLRKNLVSDVLVGGGAAVFRNPVQFFSLVEGDGTRRDAEYETEAALDQYFYHSNVAPFVAYRFAQRFGISNPTPRYVHTIADAFRSGQYIYEEEGHQVFFGTNEYGDMKATIAAVLLDREARDILLDADPTHGSLREPLLKVVGLMRSFEFMAASKAPFPNLRNMEERIGQMVHEIPSVFSFFLPEYQPDGVVAEAGFVAPEAEAYSAPNLVSTINGLSSMVKYGLDRCFEGFGEGSNNRMCGLRPIGDFEGSSGGLNYILSDVSSSSSIVDEIATILTGGRLSRSTRLRAQEIYEAEQDKIIAEIQVMQVVLATPEYHATGTVTKSGMSRPTLPVFPPSPIPYKAVVFLLLRGGYDSYNLIVPDSGCSTVNSAGLNLREQYEEVRGVLAFTEEERNQKIDLGNSRGCSIWAIHPAMTIIPELWEDGHLGWFFNTGVLNAASTNKNNFADVTETQLFAHNSMQEESRRLDPLNINIRTGICGRAAAALDSRGFRSGAISIGSPSVAVNGGRDGPIPSIINNRGPDPLLPRSENDNFDPTDDILAANQAHDVSSSVFGETFSAAMTKAFQETSFFESALQDAEDYLVEPATRDERNMGIITKLMQTRNSRGVDRDFFFVDKGGWDHHNQLKASQQEQFSELNSELNLFVNELKDKGLWDKVTLVLVSDFGRTLTPNSNQGSDHAWGGHYFVMGGSVKEGVALGEYPNDITTDGPLNLGRGRIIPTMAWESMWYPVFHWMGMDPMDVDKVMPNAIRTGTPLFDKDAVFRPET